MNSEVNETKSIRARLAPEKRHPNRLPCVFLFRTRLNRKVEPVKLEEHNQEWSAICVGRQISDLICWAIHPHPEALPDGWAAAYKLKITDAVNAAEKWHASDACLIDRLRSAKRLAFQFIALINDRPKISTVPVEEWPIQSYRQLFDDLAECSRFFSSWRVEPAPSAQEDQIPELPGDDAAEQEQMQFSSRTFVNQDIRDALNRQQRRKDVSTSTADRYVRKAKNAGKIKRDGKSPMHIRLDLMRELNLTDDPS